MNQVTMKRSLLFVSLAFSAVLYSQPTIDGTTSDAAYSSSGSSIYSAILNYTSGRDGYGSTNNIGHVKYYTDGTDIYIAIESKLEANGNRVFLFLDFSDYNGRASGNALGTFPDGTGVINDASNTNIRLGMEVDYIFEFNIFGGTNCYFDANRIGTSGFFNAGTFVGSSDLAGTSVTPTGLNTNVFTSANPGVTFAYNNGGGANQGIEVKIPIASLPGVANINTIQLQAVIGNGSNPTHFSNESIPGDLGETNPGTNPNLAALTASAELPLPVELISVSAAVSKKDVHLQWKTAAEISNAGFEVQKRNGNTWTSLRFIEGHGTTNAPQHYQFTDSNVPAGKQVYRLKQMDRDGKFSYSTEVEVFVGLTAGDYALSQNFPNPFNPSTSFTFAVKQQQHVRVKVFNLVGQEVATLVNGLVEPNVLQKVDFNASQLSSGVYFYALRTADRHEIRKFMLMK